MVELRTFSVAGGGWVVAARGDLDADGARQVGDAVKSCDGPVIVDLLRAHFVDLDVLDALVERVDARFVAERPLRDALDLIGLRRHVDVSPTLAAALG